MKYSYTGLDCLSLPENFSGAGYYIYYLVRALLQSRRDFPIAVLSKPNHSDLFSPYLQPDDKIVSIPLKSRIQRLYFYEFGLERILVNEKIVLLHATHYLCPPANRNYKIITTFHDMGFFLFPDYYPFSKRLFFTKRMGTFLNRSNKIIAISKSTWDTVAKYFPEQSHKIKLIYPGADHLMNESTTAQSSVKSEIPNILAVNAFEKRKNIPFIIKLFDYLKENFRIEHQLMLIGHFANDYKQILKAREQSNFSRDIYVLKSIPLEQLIQFYKHSNFFMNASFYEGFGFSPLEAINFGLPTFVFNNSVVNEIFGNHPYAFTDFDVENWAEYICSEMNNNFTNKISPDSIQHLTWQNTAERFIDLFHQFHSEGETALAS